MKRAYRAVLLDPPPEDYLLPITVSSWRLHKSSAEEAAVAFRSAVGNKSARIEIQECRAEFYEIEWVNEETKKTGKLIVLLPASSDHFVEASFCLIESFGASNITARSISSVRVGACQLNRMRKNRP